MATKVTRVVTEECLDRPSCGSGLTVERGPGWLFLRVGDVTGSECRTLADAVWQTIREHGASRVVLELDRVTKVDAALGDAIAAIGGRVRDAGGLIRLCGLSPPQLSGLQRCPEVAAVPHFETRSEAVGGPQVGGSRCE
ncbi:MAG: STAS domain-containing protein [Planctomycetes bacterium]|nr:STAS domain-containing protein [Planctomycetota bacterium]